MVSLELNLMNDNFEHKCPGNVVRFLQYIKYLELIKISFIDVWTLINVSLNTFLPCRTLIKPLFNFSPVKYSPPLIWCIKVFALVQLSVHLPGLFQMIARRLSDLSCDENEFMKAKSVYEAALKNSGHDSNLEYLNTSN